ncbi:MAG: BadF/BadG/BcrA/BcrD ATPase family protein [Solirubrobacteraceae bacterium]
MNRDSLVQLPQALVQGAATSQAHYVMGIDGGATKTLAAVLDLERHEVHLAEGGPSNEDAVGAAAAVDTLLSVADRALQRAGVAERDLATVVLAVAGTDTPAIARNVCSARGDDWIVVNDVVGAWAAATGGRPGVGAISGTGSNVFGVGPGGRPWRVGGWGHLLGDQGSGYWLGTESIRAALADRDGSGPQTALAGAAVEFFGVQSVEALAALVYSKPLTKGEIAAFAVRTCELAQGGDAVAHELYTRGAHELASQIAAVIGHTGLGGGEEEFPVGLIGSVFRAGPIFVDPIVAAVHGVAPNARIDVVEMAPVGGSLQLAARACGRADAIEPEQLRSLLDARLADGR